MKYWRMMPKHGAKSVLLDDVNRYWVCDAPDTWTMLLEDKIYTESNLQKMYAEKPVPQGLQAIAWRFISPIGQKVEGVWHMVIIKL